MKIKDFLPKVKGISDDTRKTSKGDLFFVRRREDFDIFPLLKTVEDKVVAFVAANIDKDRLADLKKPLILVKDVQTAFENAVDKFYGFKNKDFTFIGATGTKGKTTTAAFIYDFLISQGLKAALIGTVHYRVANKVYKAANTTPGYLALRQLFSEIKREKTKFVVMEVSSHAIEQKRISGIDFSACVFTNLSHEHLDYHKTMQRYFKAKQKLFIDNKSAIKAVNLDDHYGRLIKRRFKKVISFGLKAKADLMVCDVVLNKSKTQFSFICKKQKYPVATTLLAEHNIYNILAGVTVLSGLGFSLNKLARFIPKFKGVDGRLERVADDVFVDYAHTHVALRKSLQALAKIGYKRIICVFGCGGNRDKAKRPLMGQVACINAQYSIVTTDNPRNEDARQICSQIKKGFKKKNYKVIVDRKKAIKEALKIKKSYNDCCVLVAGKGHEDYQLIKGKKYPFKDKQVIQQIVKKLF